MIDRICCGKRMANLRKKRGMSQEELARRLGVTSQAVSKWECGSSLPDIELLLELSWLYNISINEILEGGNLLMKLSNRHYETDGVAYFLPKGERGYNVEWADEIVKNGWVKQNWEYNKTNHEYLDIANKINAHGGIILEIGAGPGGGYMPAVLSDNPDATLIISDLSPTVVNEWKKLLDKELNPANVYYAVIDNCDMPFKDNSIDVISDGGGLGNTEGDKLKALDEIYRVLKPGGLFVTGTGFVTQETLRTLPDDVQRTLTEKRPDIFESLYEATVTAGFKKIDSVITGCWYTESDDSSIAELARSLGVNLKFTAYLRYCEK